MSFFSNWFGSFPGSGSGSGSSDVTGAEKNAAEAKERAAEAEKKAAEAKEAAAKADATLAELKQKQATPPGDVPKPVGGGRQSKQKFSKKRKGGKKRVRTNKKHR